MGTVEYFFRIGIIIWGPTYRLCDEEEESLEYVLSLAHQYYVKLGKVADPHQRKRSHLGPLQYHN